MSTTQDNELQELLSSDAYLFLAECGVNIVNARKHDLPRIRNAIVKAQSIYSCKAELDEIVRALESANIGPLLRNHPSNSCPYSWMHQRLSHQECSKTCSLWIWTLRGPTGVIWKKKLHCSGSPSCWIWVKMVAYYFKMMIQRHRPIQSLSQISWALSQAQLKSPLWALYPLSR